MDDLVVLCDGEAESVHNRAGVKTPVTLGLGHNFLVKGEHAGTRTGLDKLPVEVEVQIENPIGILSTRPSQLAESRVEPLETSHQLEAKRWRKHGGPLAREAFHVPNDTIKFARVLSGERSHHQARFAVSRGARHNQPFVLEPLKRLARAYDSLPTALPVPPRPPGSRGPAGHAR